MYQVNYNDCKTVQDHYLKSVDELAKGYVKEYVQYLPHIREYMQNCDSYRELGTNQGASASAVFLENPKFVELIDKSFSRFNPSKKYFETYAKENEIEFNTVESSSLDVKISRKTDFLLVDSVHKYNHVIQELNLYSPFVNKFIMIHDTVGFPEVGKAVNNFVADSTIWKIDYHLDHPKAGYTVLKKI
jgi:hypothetical protein